MKRFILLLSLLFCLWSAAPVDAANRFLTCNTTCTITAADTSIWGTTTGGTGASVPGSADAVILDGATCVGGTTCTATMGAGYNPTWQSITMGACTASTAGCILDFSVNNNSITLSSSLSSSGTGTRTLNMGNGTWTFSGVSIVFLDFTTTTNFTFNANSSTISVTGATGSKSLTSGGKTFNIVSISNQTNGAVTFNGGPTIATLNVTAPANLRIASSATMTITNAFTWSGTSTNQISLEATTVGTVGTISVASGSPTMSWAAVRDITFTGGATFTATNSFNNLGNTGITITAPSTSGGGPNIIGGWLTKRDLAPAANDNTPMWLGAAA